MSGVRNERTEMENVHCGKFVLFHSSDGADCEHFTVKHDCPIYILQIDTAAGKNRIVTLLHINWLAMKLNY